MSHYYHHPDPPDPDPLWTHPDSPHWETPQEPTPKPYDNRIWWFIIALGAPMLLCSGLLLTVFASDDKPQPAATAPAAPAATAPAASTPATDPSPTTYKIGKPFRSGDIQYTIHGAKTSATKTDGLTAGEPQGQYTRIDITIKNMSTRPISFDTNNLIRVEDKDGRQFNSDAAANLAGNQGGTGWPAGINPGNQARVTVYFDMPTDVKAIRMVVSAGTTAFKTDAIVPLEADR